MKTINDLTEGLMAQFTKIQNASGSSESIKLEIDRSRAMVELGNTVVNAAKAQIEFAKNFKPKGDEQPNVPFFNLEQLPEPAPQQTPIGETPEPNNADGGGQSKKN